MNDGFKRCPALVLGQMRSEKDVLSFMETLFLSLQTGAHLTKKELAVERKDTCVHLNVFLFCSFQMLVSVITYLWTAANTAL